MIYEKWSVADPDGCPIMQTKSTDPSTRVTKAKVNRTNDGILCADVHPRNDDRERLLPLAGKAAGQPLLVCCILSMKDNLSGTHKWCEGCLKFPQRRSHTWLSWWLLHGWLRLPMKGWLGHSWMCRHQQCSCQKRHPATFPDPLAIQSAWELLSALSVIFRNKDRLHGNTTPGHYVQFVLLWRYVGTDSFHCIFVQNWDRSTQRILPQTLVVERIRH